MTQNELIDALAEKTGNTKTTVAGILSALGSLAASELKADGAVVVLPGVGRLKSSTRPARKGRNPKTGAAMDIPASRVVKLVTSAEFTKSIA